MTRVGRTSRSLAWAELLRLPALFTVPGDALAGAAAASARPTPALFWPSDPPSVSTRPAWP